ncbi:MAG: TetR/AcrR family transcriptional regulator [Proteobacteria bacterium]|nr:TetR/AcrR family transcriptional regulator [Pseudomonadota bacterium]
MATKAKTGVQDRILKAALAIAEEKGWASAGLSAVAARAKVPVLELRRHYRDTDAIANAWFRVGLDAMLAPVPKGFSRRSPAERLEILMRRWFDALAPHRRVTAEMLSAKLWVFHPHHTVPMVFNLSRLIQWLRDLAGLDAGGRRKQIEETGLTALFVATLAVWCRDDTKNQERTRAFLSRRLGQADGLMARLFADKQ